MKEELKLWHADRAGDKAPSHLIGKTFFHPKTGSLYKVTDVGFDAERGRWMVVYIRLNAQGDRVGSCSFFHLPEDFLRDGRFLEVSQ